MCFPSSVPLGARLGAELIDEVVVVDVVDAVETVAVEVIEVHPPVHVGEHVLAPGGELASGAGDGIVGIRKVGVLPKVSAEAVTAILLGIWRVGIELNVEVEEVRGSIRILISRRP